MFCTSRQKKFWLAIFVPPTNWRALKGWSQKCWATKIRVHCCQCCASNYCWMGEAFRFDFIKHVSSVGIISLGQSLLTARKCTDSSKGPSSFHCRLFNQMPKKATIDGHASLLKKCAEGNTPNTVFKRTRLSKLKKVLKRSAFFVFIGNARKLYFLGDTQKSRWRKSMHNTCCYRRVGGHGGL